MTSWIERLNCMIRYLYFTVYFSMYFLVGLYISTSLWNSVSLCTYPSQGIVVFVFLSFLRILPLSLYFYLCVFFTLERRSPCIFISLCIFHLLDASSTSSYVVFSPPQSASHNVARPTRKYCALVNFYISEIFLAKLFVRLGNLPQSSGVPSLVQVGPQ